MKPILIGIVGGSCSGKTTFARKLFNHFGKRSLLLSQDSFYRNLDSNVDINNYNFDEPQAIDFEKMENVIKDIINKDKFVKIPIYDFKTAKAIDNKIMDCSNIEIVIIEGVFIFNNDNIRNLLDFKIFIDTDVDTRLNRRIKRDVKNRGRTIKIVIYRHNRFVKPAYDKYIEPCKKYADIII